MFATILWLLAAICLFLGFLALLGVAHFALGWVGLFIAAALFALVAYFLAGGFPSHRRL